MSKAVWIRFRSDSNMELFFIGIIIKTDQNNGKKAQ